MDGRRVGIEWSWIAHAANGIGDIHWWYQGHHWANDTFMFTLVWIADFTNTDIYVYVYIYMYISFLIHAIWSIYKIHSKERAHDLRFVVCWALVWFGASRFHPMMTPSNVMWGESIGHRRIPLTKANNTELWCFSLKSSWTKGWANSRDAGDLTHHGAHYDITVMQSYVWSSGSAATLCTLLSNCLYVHKRVILVFIALFGSQLGK